MADFDWDLILKNLKGNASPEEEIKINEMIRSNPSLQNEIDQLKKIWEVPDTDLPKPDVDKALADVMEKAEISSAEHAQPASKSKRRGRLFYITAGYTGIMKIAAILLAALTIAYFIYQQKDDSLFKQIAVQNAGRETVVLADDTKITLDAGSYLRYKESFNEEKREVFLKGEAYFEVKPDPAKPFIIHAEHAVVRVLGTKLNIRAWESTGRVTAVVVEGKVSFRSGEDAECKSEVILQKNQFSTLEKNKLPSRPQTADPGKYLSWLRREMHFKNAPLLEVLDQVERWYNLDITLSDQSYESNRISIFIENKPVENILELIALVNNFDISRDGEKVVFTPKK